MPLKDYLCLDCGHLMLDQFIRKPEEAPSMCLHCESRKIEELPSSPGGYSIKGNNSASTRPKSSGSFRGRK